jgi:hypothetical protein
VLGESLSREEQIRTKKWRVIPFGRFGVTADDNVFIQPTDRQKDVYFTLTPGVAVGWGNYEKEVKALGEFEHYFEVPDFELNTELQNFAFAKYSPTFTLFSNLVGEDAFDQDALLVGRWEFTRLTLGARVHYQTLSDADEDVGTRTKRQILKSAVTSLYDLSEKTSLEFNVTNDTYNYKTQQDYTETVVEDWINYQWLPKTRVSLGERVGFLQVENSPSQTYEQVRVRAVYNATGKLGITLSGGEEFRQVKGGNGTNLYSVFSFGASYTPFEGTMIAASAFRENSPSVTGPDENITSTGISALIKQRFFQRFYFEVEGSYRNAEYRSSLTGSTSGRTDDYISAKSSISFDITKHLSAQSAYEYRRDDSSQSGSGYVENLVTVQLNLQF